MAPGKLKQQTDHCAWKQSPAMPPLSPAQSHLKPSAVSEQSPPQHLQKQKGNTSPHCLTLLCDSAPTQPHLLGSLISVRLCPSETACGTCKKNPQRKKHTLRYLPKSQATCSNFSLPLIYLSPSPTLSLTLKAAVFRPAQYL